MSIFTSATFRGLDCTTLAVSLLLKSGGYVYHGAGKAPDAFLEKARKKTPNVIAHHDFSRFNRNSSPCIKTQFFHMKTYRNM